MTRGKNKLNTQRSARRELPTVNLTRPEVMLCQGAIPLSEIASSAQINYLRKVFVPVVMSAFDWHEMDASINQLMQSPLVMKFVKADGTLFEKVSAWLDKPNPQIIFGPPDQELNQLHAYEFYILSSIAFSSCNNTISKWTDWRKTIPQKSAEMIPLFDVSTRLIKTVELGLANLEYDNIKWNDKDILNLISFWDEYGETIIVSEMAAYDNYDEEDNDGQIIPAEDFIRLTTNDLYEVMTKDRQILDIDERRYAHRTGEQWLAWNYYTAQSSDASQCTGSLYELAKPLYNHCSSGLDVDEGELCIYLNRCLNIIRQSQQKLDPKMEAAITDIITRFGVW